MEQTGKRNKRRTNREGELGGGGIRENRVGFIALTRVGQCNSKTYQNSQA